MREPTNEEIAEMAIAATMAAKDKARELGLDWYYSILGIERAYNAVVQTLDLISVIGIKGAIDLGEALMKRELYDMEKEAEAALKEEQE